MKKIIYPIIAVVLLAGSAFTFIAGQNWQIADGYSIAFSSNDASGIFKGFKGTLVFDEQNPAGSKFDVTVDVATINRGNGLQNNHAKSDEWFNATKYPQIRFSSQKFVKADLWIFGSVEPLVTLGVFVLQTITRIDRGYIHRHIELRTGRILLVKDQGSLETFEYAGSIIAGKRDRITVCYLPVLTRNKSKCASCQKDNGYNGINNLFHDKN